MEAQLSDTMVADVESDEPRVFTIPFENVAALSHKFGLMTRRANRLGVPAPRILLQPDRVEIRRERDEFSSEWREVAYRVVDFTVSGEAPKLPGGWRLVATLQHTDAGNLIRTVPGLEGDLPVHFRTADPRHCDHCGKPRSRRDTYVVARDRGEIDPSDGRSLFPGHFQDGLVYRQVGSDCIKDFLGGANPEALAAWFAMMAGLEAMAVEAGEEGWGGSGRREKLYPLEDVLALAAGAIRQFGWVSGSMARNDIGENVERPRSATKQRVLDNLDPRTLAHLKKVSPRDVIEPDGELGALALMYWQDYLHLKDDHSDFDQNISVVVGLEHLDSRMIGYASYLPAGYLRHMEQEVEREAKRRERVAQAANMAGSAHQGKVGERLNLAVEVTFVKYLESQWGVSYLTKMVDASGNAFVWFASKEYKAGDKLKGKATVKSHQVRDEIAETQVTRGKFEVA